MEDKEIKIRQMPSHPFQNRCVPKWGQVLFLKEEEQYYMSILLAKAHT